VTDGERLEHALGLAYRHLNRRERTVQEMRRHLAKRGVDDPTTEAALVALTEQGYLDDARLARLFAEDRRELDQWGSQRIKRGLIARGIEPELAGATVGDRSEPDGEGELERALALLRRRFPIPPRERRERDRALGVLLRKGYAYEHALDALAAHARARPG
jgi:regulatory protein